MLFDNRDNSEEEEVSISPSTQSSSNSRREDEADLTESSGTSGGVAIPSAEGDGSALDESKVSLEDIHQQNEKIISLLEDIASDSQEEGEDKLRGDVENELL